MVLLLTGRHFLAYEAAVIIQHIASFGLSPLQQTATGVRPCSVLLLLLLLDVGVRVNLAADVGERVDWLFQVESVDLRSDLLLLDRLLALAVQSSHFRLWSLLFS